MKYTTYEIFFEGNDDTIECDTLEEAENQALRWSMGIDLDFMIVKVERKKVKTFRNGGEVA